MKRTKTNEERGKEKRFTRNKGGQGWTSKVLQSRPPAMGRSRMSHDKEQEHTEWEKKAVEKEGLSPSLPFMNCDGN